MKQFSVPRLGASGRIKFPATAMISRSACALLRINCRLPKLRRISGGYSFWGESPGEFVTSMSPSALQFFSCHTLSGCIPWPGCCLSALRVLHMSRTGLDRDSLLPLAHQCPLPNGPFIFPLPAITEHRGKKAMKTQAKMPRAMRIIACCFVHKYSTRIQLLASKQLRKIFAPFQTVGELLG